MHDDRVVVWDRSDVGKWEPVANVETAGIYSGLLANDLDDDINQEITTFPDELHPADALKHEFYLQGLSHIADPDLILFGPAGLKLIENKKEANSNSRSLVARSAGRGFDEVRNVTAVTATDVDGDGDLDLVVSTSTGLRIFSNRGNLTFDETTSMSILPPSGTEITAFAIADWDRDSDIDLVVATTTGGALLENMRHGRLRYRPLSDFPMLSKATSLKIADFDGNTSWDLLAAGPEGAQVVLTNRSPAGLVSIQQTNVLTSSAVRSADIGDFDNSSATDVILVSDEGPIIHSGDGSGKFIPMPRDTKNSFNGVKACVVSDLDRDGDLDLIATNDAGITFLSNQCRESDNPDNGWIELHLVGEQPKQGEQNFERRVNHINRGGMLEVKAGAQYQVAIVTGSVNHFGLGRDQKVDLVRILWTNGIPQNEIDPNPNKSISILQKLGGSCPYLFTWNGDQFEFVTDLLWNAPLGLKFAENVIAPWREWEYLKIDGNKLKAKDGEYRLRITNELWEADYFDQIKLFAIDHPFGTEIFTNEKVGPASIAEHKIHTVQNPRKPVTAKDTRGRDVLAQVVARDGIFTKTFDKRLAQGFTEEHFLEMDLGGFPDAKNVTLFLTGWMYPGSTSLRVKLSQNPDLPESRPPALYAPDANGEWREVMSYVGFPGGKTKTIAVDVTGLFTNGDHRLRIVSTLEIFWDEVFFTVDDPHVDLVQTELELASAELVDRGGVSFHSWPATGNGPDQFSYSKLVPGEHWPAMSGSFTRFGDILSLLKSRDDHLVVTSSGDEIRLAFAEPKKPIPSGWVRDFVIYNVGWDKDADLNTVYGETVEPMPFEEMTVYGELRPFDADYEKYLSEYQTRKRNPSKFWKSVQQFR